MQNLSFFKGGDNFEGFELVREYRHRRTVFDFFHLGFEVNPKVVTLEIKTTDKLQEPFYEDLMLLIAKHVKPNNQQHDNRTELSRNSGGSMVPDPTRLDQTGS